MSREVWRWREPLLHRTNASISRDPWGFYLRVWQFRLTLGPLYGWSLHKAGEFLPYGFKLWFRKPRFAFRCWRSRKVVTVYYREGSQRIVSHTRKRVPSDPPGVFWVREDR